MPKIKDEIILTSISLIDPSEDDFDKLLELSKKELFYKMSEDIFRRYPGEAIQLMPIEIETYTIRYTTVKLTLRALIYDLCITEE